MIVCINESRGDAQDALPGAIVANRVKDKF